MKMFVILNISVFSLLFFSNCINVKPKGIGLNNGKFYDCPDSPNCINTMASANDKIHYSEPISYQGSLQEAKLKILNIINSTPRTKILDESENYIHAIYISKMMKFVDDVQFYFDDNTKLIHIRSASRVGYSDLGVNRKRVDMIKKEFYGEK